MSASHTPYFRPPWAVTMWADDEAIYVELPMEPIPYIQRYPLTDGGLAKAVRVLRDLQPQPRIGSAKVKLPAPIGHIARRTALKPAPSPEALARRATALALLKKHGL